MADLIKIFGKGFSDRNAKFEKSRLYGFSKSLESLNSNLNLTIKNFPIQNGRFNMADQNFESFYLREIQFPWVFKIAEFEYNLEIMIFKMTDPIWRT